ncbi:aminoglycoside 6-adenylyltransferase [Pseudolactococcus reticulitermitis]|uniref:Aminoglycoside 6-adenylyltransferase n=1 Tax=Pseudolactococcus reticulitermitis TaxID=2025039 RepID=A0A224XB72_9LACT|nr:aminoglycoside 6-adenylyltransferase [Lactococcus reticulitermitis]GAX47394.1 aminoglycoside 6-adenylyltransferase [Lactococcus reticulitermitis]
MTSETLFNLILTTGQTNTAILMIGSEGSRNDPTVKPDPYQDFDITYFVSDADFPTFEQFDRSHFGDIMIQQILPEKNRWCWLMQFMDSNRLDLKIQPVSSVPDYLADDTLNTILLDKTGSYRNLPATSDQTHWVQRPTQTDFDNSITEFFWVSTYVLKGILRGELLYANFFFETIVREELYRLLTWRVGVDTDFSLSVGKAHKRLPDYFEGLERLYDLSDLTRTSQALSTALTMVDDLLPSLSHDLQLTYDKTAVDRTTDYIFRQL